MPPSLQHPDPSDRPRRKGQKVWWLTLGLWGLSALWALWLRRPDPATVSVDAKAQANKPRAPVRIPQSWIEQLTPAAPEKKIRTKIRGNLLLEVLYQDGEPLWTMPSKLWATAVSTPVTEPSPEGTPLRWPGAAGALGGQRELALDVPDAPMVLMPPPEQGCQVRWWLDGEPMAQAQGCDLDGGFELDIEEVAGTEGWLELSYPGRLAAQLPVSVGPSSLNVGKIALGYGFAAGLRVTDPEGKPVSGVRTQLRHYGMRNNQPALLGQTDSSGEMHWDTLPAGEATVELRAPGYRTQSVQIGAPRDELVEAQLEPVDRLWGQVYMPTAAQQTGQSEQELFGKVKVRLAGSGIWPPRVEGCKDDGGFVFSQIPSGVYAVEAYVDDEELQLASFPLENVPSDHSVSLSLLPAFSLALELLDDEGQPVPGAKVSAKGNALGLLARECVADEVGFCKLAALVPASYEISVHAEGFLPFTQTLDRSFALDAPVQESMAWTLESAPSCVARIQGPSGEPLAMAQVWVQRAGGGNAVAKGKRDVVAVGVSDADGFVGFDPLAPGRYRLGARLEGWTLAKDEVFVPGPACESMRLTMQPAVRVFGVVNDDRGEAVADASVQLRAANGQVLARTRTDAEGIYELEDARGRVQLVVRGTGYKPYTQQLMLRPREGAKREELVTLSLMQTGHLELALVDVDGEPKEHVQVEFVDPKGLQDKIFAVADRHGVVELDRLPLGKWSVRAYCGGTICLQKTLKWSSSEGVVQKKWLLKDPWELLLTVLDDVAEPIVGAQLRVGEQQLVSNERGEATLRGLFADELAVRVQAKRFVAQTVQFQRPKEDTQRTETLTLEYAGALEGEVLDAWGTGIADAKLSVRWEQGQVRGQTGPAGHFLLRGLPAGDWTMTVEPPASRPDLPEKKVPVNIRSQIITRDLFVTLGEL